jgi:TPR repeat protein
LNYGSCLLGRLGFELDIARIIRYFRNSANSDHAVSQLLFAFLLENGIGISSHVILAVKYYESAARSLLSACAFSGWRL